MKRRKKGPTIVFGKGAAFEGEDTALGRTMEYGGVHEPAGCTVGETSDGTPRPLDFRNFERVDWSMFDEEES